MVLWIFRRWYPEMHARKLNTATPPDTSHRSDKILRSYTVPRDVSKSSPVLERPAESPWGKVRSPDKPVFGQRSFKVFPAQRADWLFDVEMQVEGMHQIEASELELVEDVHVTDDAINAPGALNLPVPAVDPSPPLETFVFDPRLKYRPAKEVQPAKLAANPTHSMDEQRSAWNEELLKRWRFEGAESFAQQHLASTAVGNARQLARQLRLSGKCIAVFQGHRWLYPVFQIDPDTKRAYPEVLDLIDCYPGMAKSTDMLKSNRSFSLLRWMDQPHSELSGFTPMALWERGDRAAVVRALKTEL